MGPVAERARWTEKTLIFWKRMLMTTLVAHGQIMGAKCQRSVCSSAFPRHWPAATSCTRRSNQHPRTRQEQMAPGPALYGHIPYLAHDPRGSSSSCDRYGHLRAQLFAVSGLVTTVRPHHSDCCRPQVRSSTATAQASQRARARSTFQACALASVSGRPRIP